MIIVAGFIHINPSEVEAFIIASQGAQEATRSNLANLAFAMAIDDREAGRIVLFERWTGPSELDDHLTQQVMREFFSTWAGKARIDVQRYSVAESPALA